MTLAWVVSVTMFAVAMSATPGPNNTMLTASGANYGFRRSLPHMIGICVGCAIILTIVGTFGSPLVANPHVHDVLKWVGVAYLLWLAWKIATARREADGAPGAASGRPLTLVQGALFQLVNPKLWVIAGSAIVTYIGGEDGTFVSAAVLALIFGIVTFPAGVLWTLIGVGAGRLLSTDRAMRLFNLVMAALLVASLIPIVFE